MKGHGLSHQFPIQIGDTSLKQLHGVLSEPQVQLFSHYGYGVIRYKVSKLEVQKH